jgi:hypothetical protein
MSEIRRQMYCDSVSSATVQLRRVPGVSAGSDSEPGTVIHAMSLTTGFNSSSNADTAFWKTNCTKYEVIIRRLT